MIFVSDHMDEAAVDTALKAGTGEFARTSIVNRPAVAVTIRYSLDEDRKERERQKTEDTLRKLWRAVEQSADLVMITNRERVMEYVNPAFESLTGYSLGELMGQTPRVLKSGQQTAERSKELWQTILAGSVFRCTMVNRKKNRDVFVAEKTATLLRDNDGKITHFVSRDRDITDRRRMENQLQQAQKMGACPRTPYRSTRRLHSADGHRLGNGIAPEHVLHLFEPFYTTKEEGEGTGLDLAMVYGIVKENGGFICVNSEPGLGTTFKIYLPRARQVKLVLQPASLPAEGCPRGCETLLLTEDKAAVRQSTRVSELEGLYRSGSNEWGRRPDPRGGIRRHHRFDDH